MNHNKSIPWFLLIALLLLTVACGKAEQTEEETSLFTGVIGKKMSIHRQASDNSSVVGQVIPGQRVDIHWKGKKWTRIESGRQMGYVNTKYVELVQRKNPFQGPMPGVSNHMAVARVTEDFSFKPEGYRYPIQVKKGALLSIESLIDGKVKFPYRREEELVSVKQAVLDVMPFVPWEEAQTGDLLYAFTTFYSTSMNKEGNAGRMYNIQLASDRLTHIIIPAGESFSYNGICGPYSSENGYQAAPILAGESTMGFGGGVCQVCSTIYNIVLRMPTVIEDMNWHSQGGVSYLPAGFDATVSNTKDMVFRNALPYAVRLEFENLYGVMTALLYRY